MEANLGKRVGKDEKESNSRGHFMKLHLKRHFTFIYAFMPRFYSIACLSKLHSIITSFVEMHGVMGQKHRNA